MCERTKLFRLRKRAARLNFIIRPAVYILQSVDTNKFMTFDSLKDVEAWLDAMEHKQEATTNEKN